MARLGLAYVAAMLVACSGVEVSLSSASSDEALRRAAESSGNQGLNLMSDIGAAELREEESFVPSSVANRKLDILLVIDDSASMQGYRDSLAANLSHLFTDTALLSSDWRVGVISSARGSLLLQPFITIDNWQQEFAAQVRNPASGHSRDSDVERALFNAGRALSGDAGRRWLRTNSIAVVLLITNEDHRQCDRDAESCSEEAAYSLQNFYEQMRILRRPQVTAKVYGILSDEEARREHFLQDIVVEGGDRDSLFTEWKTLSDSYRSVLQNISLSVADSLQSNFVLQEEYSGGEVEVVVHTAEGRQTTLSRDEYDIAGKMLSIHEGLLDEMGEVVSVVVKYGYLGIE